MQKENDTYWVWIYLSGDIDVVKQICREYVMRGLCVTVEPIDYIYTGGQEKGVRVGLINYPRFPTTPEEIWNIAVELANLLRDRTFQHSVLIMDSKRSLWDSIRENN